MHILRDQRQKSAHMKNPLPPDWNIKENQNRAYPPAILNCLPSHPIMKHRFQFLNGLGCINIFIDSTVAFSQQHGQIKIDAPDFIMLIVQWIEENLCEY